MFSDMQVTDDLDENSFHGVKAISEWTQERIRKELEPAFVCMRQREVKDPIVLVLSFPSPFFSVVTAHLWLSSVKAPQEYINEWAWLCSNKTL